jgi:regulator of protease activity HflC (stomatin/prohibitin superfamily)
MNAPLLLLLAGSTLILVSLKRVPEGQAFTVYRFGSYRRTLDAGLHWIMPLVERIAHRVSLTGRVLSVSSGALPAAQGRIYYQVLDVARADPEVDHLDQVLLDAARDAWLRNAADWANSPANEFNAGLKRELNAQLRARGVTVTRCQLERLT